MKQLSLILLSLFISTAVLSQDKNQINVLISEGVKLHDAGKFEEALGKYKEALKLDPDNSTANYEIAYTLSSSKSDKDAIPYLNKIIEGNSTNKGGAYDMLGSIYDNQGKTDKAIEYYKLGIKAQPEYQGLYFNLAITYSRLGKNEEALQYLTKSLQLNPKHASSHRLYALINMADSGNKICALLGYCNFLILEPNSQRSVKAYQDVRSILSSGSTKKDGVNNITINHNASEKDPDLGAASLALSISSLTPGIAGLAEADQLELQLKTIFGITGELSEKKKEKDFFWSFYADYFYKLSKSEFMPLIARIIGFSSNQEEKKKWITEHEQLLTDYSVWEAANAHN